MSVERENLDLPDGFKRELKALYQPEIAFPQARDAEILRQATRGRQRWKFSRWTMSSAIAAAVAVVIGGIVWWQFASPPETPYVRTGDVRDAFYLARQLKSGRTVGASWDANGDGIVNQQDVQVVALAAVKIGEGGVR